MDPTPWIPVIAQLGFPVAVAAYLLWRLEVWMRQLTEIKSDLVRIISALDRHTAALTRDPPLR